MAGLRGCRLTRAGDWFCAKRKERSLLSISHERRPLSTFSFRSHNEVCARAELVKTLPLTKRVSFIKLFSLTAPLLSAARSILHYYFTSSLANSDYRKTTKAKTKRGR